MSDLDRYQYGYDRDSGRQWKANLTATGRDEFYAYDPLNRLTDLQRGTLNGTRTGIGGTPARELAWTLDPTGNWPGYLTKTSGTTDLDQARTHNPVNEVTGISAAGGTPVWATPAYDAAGNTTSFPRPDAPTSSFTATYDAWNRMVSVTDGASAVAEYEYDGFNRRTVKKTYAGGTLAETRHAYYTDRWQDVEERVGSSTSADVQYVWGTRYVDELVCRDEPATPRRLYALQDANYNVTAIADTAGAVVERYGFDPYGQRTVFDASWTVRTSSSYGWTIGHQGLIHDPETSLIYNRNRMLHPGLGRFTQRDPEGYIDGVDLYQYQNGNACNFLDASGLDVNWDVINCIERAVMGNRAAASICLDAIAACIAVPGPENPFCWYAAACLASLGLCIPPGDDPCPGPPCKGPCTCTSTNVFDPPGTPPGKWTPAVTSSGECASIGKNSGDPYLKISCSCP